MSSELDLCLLVIHTLRKACKNRVRLVVITCSERSSCVYNMETQNSTYQSRSNHSSLVGNNAFNKLPSPAPRGLGEGSVCLLTFFLSPTSLLYGFARGVGVRLFCSLTPRTPFRGASFPVTIGLIWSGLLGFLSAIRLTVPCGIPLASKYKKSAMHLGGNEEQRTERSSHLSSLALHQHQRRRIPHIPMKQRLIHFPREACYRPPRYYGYSEVRLSFDGGGTWKMS